MTLRLTQDYINTGNKYNQHFSRNILDIDFRINSARSTSAPENYRIPLLRFVTSTITSVRVVDSYRAANPRAAFYTPQRSRSTGSRRLARPPILG